MTRQPKTTMPGEAVAIPGKTPGNDATDSRTTFRHRKWLNVGVLAGLSAFSLVIGARDLAVGGFSWSDAPLHAMDGVFLHDLVQERPEGSLRSWAEQYYLRHQCLGLVVYYPPLFAAVEAVVFLLLGVSVWAARLTVLIFVVGAVWLIYLLARDLFGITAGIAAAVLSIASPAGVIWARQLMLEWPATFFVVLALLGYCRYLKRAGWTTGILTALGCSAAYLTKQTAVFALVLIMLHAWWDYHWPKLLKRSFLIPMAAALLLIAGYGLATGGYNALAPHLLFGSPALRHVLHSQAWTWYLASGRLSTIIGWPMAIGAALAITVILAAYLRNYLRLLRTVLRGGAQEPNVPPASPQADTANQHIPQGSLMLPAVWFFLWYVICSVFAAKEERYFFFAVPAIAMLAAGGVARLDGRRRVGIGSAVLLVLCCIQVFEALGMPARRLPTLKPTVDVLVQLGDADLVLVDAVRDGQFIFDVRTSPEARSRIIPMRASKFLYSRAARTRYDYQAHVSTPDELYGWLDRYGIRYIVMEDRLPVTTDRSWDVPPRIMLRETVRGNPRFELVHRLPLAGDDPAWRNVNLVTYRYRDAKPRRSDTITVHIPAMGREITLTLPPPATRPASE